MCGIGGRTIAEARLRISYAEFLSWVRYRAKRGSLNAGIRSEFGAAQVASILANAHFKGPYRTHDFAPYHDQPAVTLDQAMKSWA